MAWTSGASRPEQEGLQRGGLARELRDAWETGALAHPSHCVNADREGSRVQPARDMKRC